MPTESDPIDVHVGKAIERARKAKGLTQQQLAEAIGVRFQQVQKYERGFNRVSASRLYRIARTIGLEVSQFFPARDPGTAAHVAEDAPSYTVQGTVNHGATRRLIAAFRALESDEARRAVIDHVEALSVKADD